MIIITMVVFRQLQLANEIDLGYDKKDLVTIPINGPMKEHCDAAKRDLSSHPNIKSVSMTSWTPLGIYSSDDGFDWEGKAPDVNPSVLRLCTDADFLKTFDIQMSEGSFYSIEIPSEPSDMSGGIVINETFAAIMDVDNPVGMRLSRDGIDFTIIGVMRDFHYGSLYNTIGPVAAYLQRETNTVPKNRYRFMCLKVESEYFSETITAIKNVYEKYNPWRPYTYRILEEDYYRLYRSDQQMGAIIRYFTGIAIIISSLGLFGLASYMAERRTKEIGIRKVLGSTVSSIVLMLTKEFAKWILLANAIAWPIAWFLSNNWLANFIYRIEMDWDIFFLSGLGALILAIVTVSTQAVKAARAVPVDALNYE
jgi:ABC-type antimicrobial peptide transport system permease subunit